jgi:acyl-CoA synthetase (AMP-forming)/AMP-acid ligase II
MYGIGFWLTRHAELHPARSAISAPGQSYSYGELNALANRAAHGLRGLGVNPGGRVGLLALNTPEFLAAFFVEALPRSSLGKVNRSELKSAYGA